MFCTITSLVVLSTETSIDVYDLLMTLSSSSGNFFTSFSSTRGTSSVWRNPCSFHPAVTLSQLELICHHFHQLGNTSFSNLITRIGFWGSRILPSPLLEQLDHNFALLLALLFLSWVLGSHPLLFFFFLGPSVPSIGTCFIKPTTRSMGVLLGESSAHLLADSFSACLAPRRRLRSGLCFVLQAHAAEYFSCIAVTPRFRVSLHTTLLSLVVRWLRRQPSRSPASPILDAYFLSFAPILGFGSSILPRSFASSRLTAIFWSSSSTSCHFRAASCATCRLVCSSSSILW